MSKANKQAWEAAHDAARTVLKKHTKDYKYQPMGSIWYEISGQLRQTGNSVDLDAVKQWWTTESQQRQIMQAILEKAGFKQDGNVFRWEEKSVEK